ncbi:MAG: hypothetical protein KAS32_30695, partial [Candidatus Peribacteraceae bacterium]|nr:hypothetical protein [Candidatus Peribacteraceae bacterium]
MRVKLGLLLAFILCITLFSFIHISNNVIAVSETTASCNDGTFLGECSNDRPLKCVSDSGILKLVPRCNECCGNGYTCSLDNKHCVLISGECNDGTPFDQCSVDKPAFCTHDGNLINNCTKCDCPIGYECTKTGECEEITQFQDCYDGTLGGQCSNTKPLFCSDGLLVKNCTKCSCYDGYTCADNGECMGVCSDGTKKGTCSETKPFACIMYNNELKLLPMCNDCGCPDGYECGGDNIRCSEIEYKCDDGTPYESCSYTMPFYCDNGELIDDCDICGCPDGFDCTENGECSYSPKSCSDGTVHGHCSETIPLYCDDAYLKP